MRCYFFFCIIAVAVSQQLTQLPSKVTNLSFTDRDKSFTTERILSKKTEDLSKISMQREQILNANSANGVFKKEKHENNPSGLYKNDISCYLNNIIHCLTYTVPFVNLVQSSGSDQTCSKVVQKVGEDDFFHKICFLCALKRHISQTSNGDQPTITPSYFYSLISEFENYIQMGERKNPDELLGALIFFLEESCVPKEAQEMFNFFRFISTQCQNCWEWSKIITYNSTVEVEVQKYDLSVFQALVRHFQHGQRVSYSSQSDVCEHCETFADRWRYKKLFNAPQVLILNLIRDDTHSYSTSHRIQYDHVLNLTKIMTFEEQEEVIYDLYGIVVQSEKESKSHNYQTFIKNINGIWYHINGDQVQQSDTTEVFLTQHLIFRVSHFFYRLHHINHTRCSI